MIDFNIHWKGCPHRTFPRIGITSSRPRTNFTRCTSHTNRSTCEIHNCQALEQARRKQRIEARGRRSRTSRASAVTRSQIRASKQAREEICGWGSPRSNIAGKHQESGRIFSADEIVDSKTPHSSEIIIGSPWIDSVDGACSAIRRIKTCVAKRNIKSQAGIRSNSLSSRKLPGGPVESLHRYQAIAGTFEPQSSRVQDSRSLYRKYNPSIRTGSASPVRSKAFLAASTLASLYEEQTTPPITLIADDPTKKEISGGNTPFIGASRLASIAQGKSFCSSAHSIVQSIASRHSSRSPSQRRALKRFTRELDLYLQIAKQVPNQTPISSALSTSFSTQTIHTIQELKPYHSEFHAAGLAVTSAEQRNQARLDFQLYGRRKTVPEAQPLPYELGSSGLLAEFEIQRRRTLSDIEEPPRSSLSDENMGIKGSNLLTKNWVSDSLESKGESSAITTPSEETIIEWAPEYQREVPTNRLESSPCCDLAPPIMRISSPAKAYCPDSLVSPKCTTSLAKKSLPWLRKPQTTAEPSPELGAAIKHTRLSKLAGDATASPPYSDVTSQPNSKSSSIVLNLDTPPEHKRPIPPHIPKTSTGIASSTPPTAPTTISYPQPFVSPGEIDNIGVANFASPEHLANQTRAMLTNGDTVCQKDIPLLKNHATQTCAAPSFITRAPHFTTQIPVTVQSQQRRGLILKSSGIGETRRRQLPQEAKTVSISGPANPHQISLPASNIASQYFPSSPIHCTQCNVELNPASDSKVRPNLTSVSELSIGFEPILKKRNTHIYTSTNNIASRSSQRHVQRDFLSNQHGERRRTVTGSKDTHKEPDISADEEHFTRKFDVRKNGENATTSERIPAPLPDPIKQKSTSERGLAPQPKTTSMPQANQSSHLSRSTKPGFGQDQVLSYTELLDIPISLDINPELSFSESIGDLQNHLTSLERKTRQEGDTKKLFKGLRVATAAACEEGVNKLLEDITGYKVRKMLMDISALDGLGVNTLAHVARQTVKKRGGDLRMLQMTQIIKEEEDREGNSERGFGFGDGDGTWENSLEEVARMGEKKLGKLPRSLSGGRRKNSKNTEKTSRYRALGLVAEDQGVKMREQAEALSDEVSARED